MRILRNISFGLLAIIIIILATTTIVEDFKGTDFVRDYVYNSVFFIVIWSALTVFSVAYILKRKRYKSPFVFLIHFSFVVILSGALTTWISGKKGLVHLRENQQTTIFTTEKGEEFTFPFSTSLKKFNVIYYQGTQTPQDFSSEISFFKDNKKTISARVSMNKIVSYKGYRFFQTSYDDDNKGTYLSVSYDPNGITVTYFGYGLLLFSLLIFFFEKKSEFYKLLKNPLLKNSGLILVFLLGSANLKAEPTKEPLKVLPQKTAEEFCDLYTLYNGRICPLQTLAKDFTVKLYGKPSYKGYSFEQVFTGWLFYYKSWSKEPMIKIKSKKTQRLLGVDSKYTSFESFFDKKNGYKLYDELQKIYKGEKGVDKKGVRKADEKYNIIAMLYFGKLMTIFPSKTDNGVNWYTSNSDLPKNMLEQKKVFIRKVQGYLLELAKFEDYKHFEKFCKRIKKYQEKEVGITSLPTQKRFKAEKLYNKIDYSKILFMIFLTIGIVAFIYFTSCLISKNTINNKVIWVLNIFLILGFLYLTFFISLRWYVSQHFPCTNGYETMQFLAWVSLFTTLFLQLKIRLVLPFGFLLSGLTLLVATLGQSSPKITHLMPVLSSPLLSIHVATIMVSYLLFGFIMLNGVIGVILYFFKKEDTEQIKRLQIISQILLYPALFLLTIGTFLGAVWANVSWGRYWAWDPKEVWALITMLVYSFPLHSVSLQRFQRPLFFHIFSILAFFSVLFTYFGVNFVLGGMHSYANG